MDGDYSIDDYKGIRRSLQPHGLRSRLIVILASFVITFGGALLLASPANAEETPSPTPPPTETATPAVTATPTPSVTPDPVFVTVTVTETKVVTVTKTINNTKTVTQVVTVPAPPVESPPWAQSPDVLGESSGPETPSTTPTPPQGKADDGDDVSALVPVGLGLLAVGGTGLVIVGAVGRSRKRRERSDYKAQHAADDDHNVDDYNPDLYSQEVPLDETAIQPEVHGDEPTSELPKTEPDPRSGRWI